MQYFKRERVTGLLAALVMFIGGTSTALAVGTASGTVVTNIATVDYVVGTDARSADNSLTPTTFTVDNRVDVNVTGVITATDVSPTSTNEVLAFDVTNEGNTAQGYAFSVLPAAPTVMENVRIYIDHPVNGSVGTFDIANDVEYTGGNFAAMAGLGTEFEFGAGSDAGLDHDNGAGGPLTVRVYIVADTTAAATSGQTETFDLIATTLNSGTNVVTEGDPTAIPVIVPTSGVDNVFADPLGSATGDVARDGIHSASGTYTVQNAALTVTKTIINVNDEFNGDGGFNIPNAVVRYQVVIENTGTGPTNTDSLVFTDPIPANTKVCYAVVAITGRCAAADLPSITIAGSSITGSTLAYDENNLDTFVYGPTADTQGADTDVSDIRYTTTGFLDAGESITITFGVVIE